MDFFRDINVALRGPVGAPQNVSDTINRLSDRLTPATLLADRRAAVLSLKGLARDCKQEVGELAIPGLVQVVTNDAEIDADIGKAALETLNTLCAVEDDEASVVAKELGFKHTDQVLADDKAAHSMFALLADTNFYTRLATLQFLATLLQNRRQVVQGYFLTAPVGATAIVSVLEDKREIIRSEALTIFQSLTSHSPDIQKILSFEGSFEKLFNIVTQEGGVDGGIVAQEALTCVDGLLRFNASNQGYFRETALPPALFSLFLFPPTLSTHEPAPQAFALQFWDKQKLSNAQLVVSIMGMLLNSKGGSPQETAAITRCFIETALASNAPTPLKFQALRLLPSNLALPLSEITLTPYMPVPESNGEEWDRLEPASALDALVDLAMNGEYNGVAMDSVGVKKRDRDGLELRTCAAAVFENFVRKEELRQAILHGMLPTDSNNPTPPPVTPLLQALTAPPNTEDSTSLDPAIVISTQLAALLFAHLLRSSSKAKALALAVIPPPSNQGGNFFVPADGTPTQPEEPEDEDPPQTLLQTLNENLSLALLSRSRADTSERDSREWDKLVVAYLCLLSQWLWEDPKSVREFLDTGGLGVLVEPINQSSEVDGVVPALCAFLLGICYEFNREPGEITRSTIYPILNRLGADSLAARMTRLREDDKFKSVGPDTVVQTYSATLHLQSGLGSKKQDSDNEGEIWFDWAFVDFWKSNYYTVQRGFGAGPDTLSAASGPNAESAMLVASLREVIKTQSDEIQALQAKLKESAISGDAFFQMSSLQEQVKSLTSQLQTSEESHKKTLKDQQDKIASLSSQLSSSASKTKEVEKEQEDLLVLLDELGSKRRRDKELMKKAGLEVSEDEDDDDDDEEDEEDEDDDEE